MIIGICGFQSSGKDTIAKYFVEKHGFIRLSFASSLKDIISVIFGWPRNKLEGLTKEDREWRNIVDPWWAKTLQMHQLTPRYVLQHFGTELFRNQFHPDIWVKIVENQINKIIQDNIKSNIVISDCRFENEIMMISRLYGKIIHVFRNPPDWVYKYREGEEPTESIHIHSSEKEWIRCHCDHEITNNGTIDELYDNIKFLVNGKIHFK